MRSPSRAFLLIGALIVGLASLSLKLPEKPNRLVNDYARVLSADDVQRLETKLVAYNDSTTTQIAVVLVKDLQGSDIFDFSQALAQEWGIGSKEHKNGVLLLIAVDERKIRIHTGYGTEGALTDALSKRIIEQEIKPSFKQGLYFEGIEAGTNAIMMALAGEYKADSSSAKKQKFPYSILVIALFLFIIAVSRMRNRGSQYSHHGRRAYGGPYFGGFGGGGSSWGGGGGGGFGGFGGGSFGGGGASGSW